MRSFRLVIVFISTLLLIKSTTATLGIDVSGTICEAMTIGDFQCLNGQGYSFGIIQTWMGGYGFNPSVGGCVSDAWKAGFAHVDVYIFMCPNCEGNGDPAAVVNTAVDNLKGVNYGMMWFDIEQCDGCWSTDLGDNANYLATAIAQAHTRGVHVGIYSSDYEWSATVGSFTGFKSLPLWYAHYDGVAAFSDVWAYSFGGWTSPVMKQFSDAGTSCISADLNWYPSGFLTLRNETLSQPPKKLDMAKIQAQIAQLRKNSITARQ